MRAWALVFVFVSSCVAAVGAQRAPEEVRVEGYSSLVSLAGGATQITQFSYRGEDPTYLERATDGKQSITWRTAPAPTDLRAPVAFACAVSFTGGEKVPPGEHDLLLNGQRLVTLTIPVKGDAQWCEGEVEARFDYLRADQYQDLEGVLYLTVPGSLLRPGEPATLTARGRPSGSRSFFCLNAITEVWTDPASQPAENPVEFVPPPPVVSPPVPDRLLFDFEEEADPARWTMRTLPEVAAPEPAAAVTLSREHVTSGKRSLKITYAGGRWPALATANLPIPGSWKEYQSLKADITVNRACVVAFRALQEKSDPRGMGWEAGVSRWNTVAFLQPGRNAVQVALHDRDNALSEQYGTVATFMILMLNPHPGEAIFVDRVRLSADRLVAEQPGFRVLGTDLEVSGVAELYDKAPNTSPPREPKRAVQLEEDFRATYADLRKGHPRTALAIFRQGQPGYDPRHPEQVYRGARDTYVNVHSPLGPNPDILLNRGADETSELFMRHRSQLLGFDLSSLPTGSRFLAARLVMVVLDLRTDPWSKGWTLDRPNMWVAEACRRPWVEMEANGYEYAHDRFWKAMSGQYYGQDPDYLPLFLAHGPANGREFSHPSEDPAVWWDFTEAVRFWTDGRRQNHGFFLHGGGGDSPLYLRSYTCQAKEIEKRPALLVIYEPKQSGVGGRE